MEGQGCKLGGKLLGHRQSPLEDVQLHLHRRRMVKVKMEYCVGGYILEGRIGSG